MIVGQVLYLFILIPAILGYFATTRHLEKQIIRPTECAALQPGAQVIAALDKLKAETLAEDKHALSETKAGCIKVTFTDDKVTKTIAGRSVIAGSVLYFGL